jgi:4-aminobutyrate aminotransferase-like enzyme
VGHEQQREAEIALERDEQVHDRRLHGDGGGPRATRETLEPATAETFAICERMRELGVVVQPTSDRMNVLKVKPPLCLTRASCDFVLEQLERALVEGW